MIQVFSREKKKGFAFKIPKYVISSQWVVRSTGILQLFQSRLMDYDYNDFFPRCCGHTGRTKYTKCRVLNASISPKGTLSPFGLRKEQQTAKHEKKFQKNCMNLAILGLSIVRDGGPHFLPKKIDPKSPTLHIWWFRFPGAQEPQKRNPPNHWGLSDAFGDRAPALRKTIIAMLATLVTTWTMESVRPGGVIHVDDSWWGKMSSTDKDCCWKLGYIPSLKPTNRP